MLPDIDLTKRVKLTGVLSSHNQACYAILNYYTIFIFMGKYNGMVSGKNRPELKQKKAPQTGI